MRNISNSAKRVGSVTFIGTFSALLAACGGGGGGGGSTPAAAVPGKSALLYIPGTAATIASVQAQNGQSAVLTTSGSTASLVTGGINTGTLTAVPSVAASSVTNYKNSAGTTNLMVSKAAGSGAALTDASYGIVTTVDSASNSYIGSYHYGTLAAATSLPTTTATYTGSFVGMEVNSAANIRGLAGNSTLNANFGAGTVSGTVTGIQTTSGTYTNYGLSTTGTISGNTYSGTTAFTSVYGGAPGSVTASGMNGAFYGTGGTQTAGSLTIQGTPTGTTALGTASNYGPLAITGGFGGRRP
jgi:hypothetical protein